MWSTSGMLAVCGGFILLYHDLAFRSRRILIMRVATFAVGFTAALVVRPGVVPVGEAVRCGGLVCLLVFVLQGMGRFRSVGLGLLALTAPVFVTLHPLRTVPKRTPAAFGLAFEEVRFQTDNGMRLAAWVIPHPHARGNVIFCHGHGRNRGHVAGLLETFHALRLNVLAFDFRGHGDSEGHTCTFGRREVLDVVAAASLMRERFPGKPLFLVGVSLGAAVSLQALPYLQDVAGVWSEGAFSDLEGVAAKKLDWLPTVLRCPLLAVYDCLGRLDCGVGLDIVPITSLPALDVSICFCHGLRDELVPFEQGRALHEVYRGPKAHYWVDAGHFDVRQRSRGEYLRRLKEFLQNHLHKS